MHLLCSLVVVFWVLIGSAEAKPSWQAEWSEALEAAKQEGQVVLYASDVYYEVFRVFQKKFPAINVVAATGRGSQISQRVMAERRAGKYLPDLYMGGSGTLYNVFYQGKVLKPIKPMLILPEVVDQSKWWGEKHIYHDDESRYILAFNGTAQSYFSYNTKLVNPKQFSTYWDFLDPKWQGKIVSYDKTVNCPLTAGRYPLVLRGETGITYGAWGMPIGPAGQTALKQQFTPATPLPEEFRVRVGNRKWLGCLLHYGQDLRQLGLEAIRSVVWIPSWPH